MADIITAVISVFALVISLTTAWLTLFRKGTVKMTKPTVIFFGPDSVRDEESFPPPKIYIRALIFSTSKKGCVIESMHAKLTRNETNQNFNIWVYGERNSLVRGSGLFVSETGISANHHFLTPKDGSDFRFIEGSYVMDIYANLLGDPKPVHLLSQPISVSSEHAKALQKPTNGLYFDWGPDSKRYIPHIDERPPRPSPEDLLQFIALP